MRIVYPQNTTEWAGAVLLAVAVMLVVLAGAKVVGYAAGGVADPNAIREAIARSDGDPNRLAESVAQSKKIAEKIKESGMFAPPPPKGSGCRYGSRQARAPNFPR